MALARLISRGQRGLTAYEVTVEVHLAGGLPSFTIVGMPAAAVRESKDRVRAALQTCALPVPARRITVHLGPADVPKEGGRFDLPIALGVVQAEHAPKWERGDLEFLGELSLGGELKPVRGVLPAALAAREASRALVLPAANAAEAALVDGAEVYGASHLVEVLDHLSGARPLPRTRAHAVSAETPAPSRDLADVRGQSGAKRALAIAAAGGHHLLLVGPPGSGKSMLAERLPDLLPPMTRDEQLAVGSLFSVAGLDTAAMFDTRRSFRAPHHGSTAAALIGGGSRPRPGEVSLAHEGVLFLDELPEFSRQALEALREPLETGAVAVARVMERVEFPARFQLVAAMNPCPCGLWGDGTDRCRCSPGEVQRYRGRISGPLLDRIDLKVEVPRVNLAAVAAGAGTGESALVREAVIAARARQLERQGDLNSALAGRELWRHANLDDAALRLLDRASARWQLSPRGTTKVLRIARTIADLAGGGDVEAQHLAEAVTLRGFDRAAGIDGGNDRL